MDDDSPGTELLFMLPILALAICSYVYLCNEEPEAGMCMLPHVEKTVERYYQQ